MCEPANTNNTLPPPCSVKWPDMFGEWDTGVWPALCAWPEVHVCFLSVMAPNSPAVARPEVIGSQWAGLKAPPPPFLFSFSSTLGLSSG